MGKDIIEGNKAIAEFMGLSKLQTEHDTFYSVNKVCTLDNWDYHVVNLFYHSSWDWLQPAWKKVYAKLIEINTTSCYHYIDKMKLALISSDIDAAWVTLVAAINFINE